MKKYFKNLILCGEINYHCLLCLETFKAVDDLEKHIRWEKHRKAIKSQTYFPKYKKDNIYKIGSIFYCEHCNFATDSLDQISNHVNEEKHKTYKANPEKVPPRSSLPKWRAGGILLDNNISLTNEEWNGILKKHCMLCDENVKDTVEHVGNTMHIVKLVTAETFEHRGVYYRRYNKDLIFCFECKITLLTEGEIDDHYAKQHSDEAIAEKQKLKSKKLFDIDEENLTATCRMCQSTVKHTFLALIDHKQMHFDEYISDSDEDLKSFEGHKDHGKLRAQLKKFGKNHFIKLNRGGSKGYCSLCGIKISAHIFNFKEHVKGQLHTGHLEMKGLVAPVLTKMPKKWPYKTKPIKKVINKFTSAGDVVIINSEIVIKTFSFFMSVGDEDGNFKCFLCNEVILIEKAKEHHKPESQHFKRMLAAPVVVTQSGDFIRRVSGTAELIREIKPGFYHCGQCNQVYPGWKLLERHFTSMKHKSKLMESNHVLTDCTCNNHDDGIGFDFINTLDLE